MSAFNTNLHVRTNLRLIYENLPLLFHTLFKINNEKVNRSIRLYFATQEQYICADVLLKLRLGIGTIAFK